MLQPDYVYLGGGERGGEIPPKTLAYDQDPETGRLIVKQKPRTHRFENTLKKEITEDLRTDKRFPTKRPMFVSIVHGLHSERGFQDCDLDNRAKTILDALKDVIYDDDAQVHALWTRKLFLQKEEEGYYRIAVKIIRDDSLLRAITNISTDLM